MTPVDDYKAQLLRTRWERDFESLARKALTPHGISLRGVALTVGRRTDGAVWLVAISLPTGIATVEVSLPPGVKHYSDAALYLTIGTILAQHGS